MAATFQSGNGGENFTVFGNDCVFLFVDCFKTPNGNVQSTTSPEREILDKLNDRVLFKSNFYKNNRYYRYKYADLVNSKICRFQRKKYEQLYV